MMRKTLTYSLAAVALLTGGVAWAQADSRPERAPDLTRAQVEQRAAEQFGRMDANDDGLLNQADRETRQQAMFDKIDADGNGALSPAEFFAMRGERREAGNERREMRGERDGPGPRIAGRPMRGMPGMGPMPGMPGMAPMGPMGAGGPMGPMGMAGAADADRDGTVTQAEFAAAALARFEQADADKDGTISRDERRAMRGPRRGPGRAG